jgi:hypothetical protein
VDSGAGIRTLAEVTSDTYRSGDAIVTVNDWLINLMDRPEVQREVSRKRNSGSLAPIF